ncbi:YfhO family protein [Sunxiuqinia sp. A32]|uniref:YfhO family protein n=1 Tax=Sunxiuqinia sp. A32 TaxID=3461496 RepID=UPI0040460100
MSKEIQDFRDSTGEETLWTNSMFGGMPAYLISAKFPGNILAKIQKSVNFIPVSVRLLMLHFVFFYVLCLVLGINPWVSFAGGVAYSFFSVLFILLVGGHITKVHTLAYMSLVVAGVIISYKKKPIGGSVLAGIGIGWMISANHPQMTYYAGIMVAILAITYFVFAVKDKLLMPFLKTSGLLIVAAILALGANYSRLYTTVEYGKYSTRGKSELTPTDDKTDGLDKSYILSYSYDFGEAMTAFIPRFKGGGMSEPLGEKSEVYQFLEKSNGKASAKRISQNLPLYWGSQPISNAPFYFGAVLIFLFVFGLFTVKSRDKWWIAAVVLISFLMSLGKNFPLLSDFLIDYLPGYNKFRDVKNIIVIQQFAMALLGVLAVKELLKKEMDKQQLLKGLKYSFIITGGLALIFVLIPGLAGNFQGESDAQLVRAGWPAQLIDALMVDRKMVLRADALRSFIFVALSAGTIWLFITKKIKAQYALILWVVLLLADMWPINKKYLNNDNFTSQKKIENPFTPTTANLEILKDTDPDYRVLNLAGNPFSDPMTSYFHKSIGGYHGAKMERYQEVIEHCISPEMMQIGQRLQKLTSESSLDSVFIGLNVLNMLNTRYAIYNPKAAPLTNTRALGNAWFVDQVRWVENADAEIAALDNFDPAKTAIIDKRFDSIVDGTKLFADEGSSIRLETYQPNYLVYEADVKGNETLAVFSEIYYPKGWDAFIDGEKVEHVRVNYILRALPVPQGKHKIEFKFQPQSYILGNKISLASSIILLLAALAVGFVEIRKKLQKQDEEEATSKA